MMRFDRNWETAAMMRRSRLRRKRCDIGVEWLNGVRASHALAAMCGPDYLTDFFRSFRRDVEYYESTGEMSRDVGIAARALWHELHNAKSTPK